MYRRAPNIKLWGGFAFALLSLALARAALCHEVTPSESQGVPCAVLENFGGDVEVLDPSRTQVANLRKDYPIPCGGWVSSSNGWAIIHHRDGHDLRIGPNTFLELPESHAGTLQADQVVLYRGEMFGSTEGAGGELRIVTANARVRIKRGTALINFSPDEQDTQVVALEGPASLENRFEPEKKVSVKPGEATSLNFKLLRVVPTYPRAVSVASLRAKLAEFRLPSEARHQIYEIAENRAKRRLAADLKTGAPPKDPDFEILHPHENAVSDRRLASVESHSTKVVQRASHRHYTYSRTSLSSDQRAKLKAEWVRKMTGGENVGEQILYPDKFYGRSQKVKVLVTVPKYHRGVHSRRSEDAEKERLLRELSQIHVQ